ncbi:MAG: proprotein convertase P-domain-containing protein [Saprospiraceae bacterium]|nr:proprotein convertase P-domain-containing protein [Saprospiraceae bacterium]
MKTLLPILALFCMGFFTSILQAQPDPASGNPWTFIDEGELRAVEGEREIIPQRYLTARLDAGALHSILKEAPLWFTEEARNKEVVLSLPMPDGTFERFRVEYAPVMAPELAAKYPMIRAYAGVGIDDPAAYLRFDMTQFGFHAIIFSTQHGTILVDPYSSEEIETHVVYLREDLSETEDWACMTEAKGDSKQMEGNSSSLFPGTCNLRTYMLALSCTGEYGIARGGTTQSVLTAMHTTMTRVNGVFEKDLSIHLEMVPNNNLLIFLDPNNDPFDNNDYLGIIEYNRHLCNEIIGENNYQIGHVFTTGTTGYGPGQVCNNNQEPCDLSIQPCHKAMGTTGRNTPAGVLFDLRVAHEMGHQFGANHTFNSYCQGSRNPSTAFEPGSGSSIMSYAGATRCQSNEYIQPYKDDYFHTISIFEINSYIESIAAYCAYSTLLINQPPVANAGFNYFIPKSTPFVLTGSAIDLNPNDIPNLTYCWEQMDNEIGAVMPPASTNTQGPMFRSFDPGILPQRYFPRLEDLVNNVSPVWEVLPSITRPMEFRVTVRDSPGISAGCTEEDGLFVNVNAAAGPFLVTSPNSAVTWTEGQMHTVTWEVAQTNQPPVNCSTVDILLSYDGGFTYSDTLATAVPNNGSAQVILPAGATNTARIMVKSNGNIFFDISNTDFVIQLGAPDFAMMATPSGVLVCPTGSVDFNLEIERFGGFSDPVTLSVSGTPLNTTAVFSTNPVVLPGASTLTIGNLAAASPGEYLLTVTGTTMGSVKDIPLMLTILEVPPAIALTAPTNNATDVSLFPALSWTGNVNANAYEWQVAANTTFASLVASGTGPASSVQLATELAGGEVYFWRVRGVAICGGTGPWSSVRSFTTVPCIVFSSTDVPVTISDIGMPTLISMLNIPETGTLSDLNVLNLGGAHTWISDLRITLISPENTEVVLLDQPCMDQDNFSLNYDAQAATSTLPCPPIGGGTYRPIGNLNNLNGEEIAGNWILQIEDLADGDGGQLESWSIRVCPANYSGLLPVEWLEFRAEAVGQEAVLNWATASELNNAGFEVQRQTREAEGFRPIGWVPARGDGYSQTNYQFTDPGTPGGMTVYYRLRQLDHDGKEDYSVVRSLFIPSAGEPAWRLFPNPASGFCILESGDNFTPSDLKVSLLNAQGQVVFQDRLSSRRFQLDLTGLPSGVYQVQVNGEDGRWTGRMVRLIP